MRRLENDLPALGAAIGPRTLAVSLVNPHNPSGTVDDAAAFDRFVETERGTHAGGRWTRPTSNTPKPTFETTQRHSSMSRAPAPTCLCLPHLGEGLWP
jgi:hypothetical protein